MSSQDMPDLPRAIEFAVGVPGRVDLEAQGRIRLGPDRCPVGVMGDGRTYENVLALRAVTSVDGMTADWFDFDAAFLRRVSNQITNQVRGVNRIVYDVTSKPPATIEWE